MDEAARRPRKGEEFEIRPDRVDPKGKALGHHGEHLVRIENAVPGQLVRARAGRTSRGVTTARAIETIDPGPRYEPARCPHTENCGGCSFQELRYDAQLEELSAILARTLAPLGTDLPVEPVVACDDPWAYRNKMDFTFGNRRWIEPGEPEGSPRDFALGLHVRGRFQKVLDVRGCAIAFPEAVPILRTVRELAVERELSAWDVYRHVGLLRNLVLRKGVATGEIMATLVTTEEAADRVAPLVHEILRAHPEITTFVQQVNSGVAVVAVGEHEIVHHGEGWIREEVAGRRFRISASSFFQTNTVQAEKLVGIVRDRLELDERDVLFDLYCGGGLLTLCAGADAREVWGFELVPEAIEDAKRNAALNERDAVRWVSGDLARSISPASLADLRAPDPDVCIVDPPRAGMHPDVVQALARLAPRRIVYVSCNPRTAATDIAVLCAGEYAVASAAPIDQFPHTPHLECVFTLDRVTGGATR